MVGAELLVCPKDTYLKEPLRFNVDLLLLQAMCRQCIRKLSAVAQFCSMWCMYHMVCCRVTGSACELSAIVYLYIHCAHLLTYNTHSTQSHSGMHI